MARKKRWRMASLPSRVGPPCSLSSSVTPACDSMGHPSTVRRKLARLPTWDRCARRKGDGFATVLVFRAEWQIVVDAAAGQKGATKRFHAVRSSKDWIARNTACRASKPSGCSRLCLSKAYNNTSSNGACCRFPLFRAVWQHWHPRARR